MQIFDVRILDGVPFDEYLKLPGLSFSGTNNRAPVNVTERMMLGTRVHTYLLEPSKYDGQHYKLVRAISLEVNKHIGALIKRGKSELTVLCTMVHRGFYLYYKGRVDLFAGGMIIDLKVSELEIVAAINHFGYNSQLNGYAIALQARASVLFSINPKTLKVQTAPIPNSVTYWEQAVLQYGKPI